jgi:hypothetical protein
MDIYILKSIHNTKISQRHSICIYFLSHLISEHILRILNLISLRSYIYMIKIRNTPFYIIIHYSFPPRKNQKKLN